MADRLTIDTDLGLVDVAAHQRPDGAWVQEVSDPKVALLLAEALAALSSPGQLRTTGVASRPLSAHRVVTADPDGRIDYPDGQQALNGALMLTDHAADEGQPVSLIVEGLVDDESWSWTVPSTLLLDRGGHISTAPCDCYGVSAPVAVAVSPTRILFRPTTPVVLA